MNCESSHMMRLLLTPSLATTAKKVATAVTDCLRILADCDYKPAILVLFDFDIHDLSGPWLKLTNPYLTLRVIAR